MGCRAHAVDEASHSGSECEMNKPEIKCPDEWHVFGQQDSVEWDVLSDVGLVLLGWSPKHHEWIKIRGDRNAYQVGPRIG